MSQIRTSASLAQELASKARQLTVLLNQRGTFLHVETIVYALFVAAWLSRDRQITLVHVFDSLPVSSKGLHQSFQALLQLESKPIRKCLEDILHVLKNHDLNATFHDSTDPILHFYEKFLAAYRFFK